MDYFDIIPEDIKYVLYSKLDYDSMINIKGMYNINFERLFKYKYPVLYKKIILVFTKLENIFYYEILYMDLLLFIKPQIHPNTRINNSILINYKELIYKNEYIILPEIKPFLNIFTINTFETLYMYKYNKNITNRLNLYPKVNNLPSLFYTHVIEDFDFNGRQFLEDSDFDVNTLNILTNYINTGIINNDDIITFNFYQINNSLNATIFSHILYLA
jgi:hypothetical protein